MKEYLKQYVAMTVALLKADGKVGTDELCVIQYLGMSYGMDGNEIKESIKNEINSNASIEDVAQTISDDKCKNMILESCAVVALADKHLAEKEIEILLRISNALGISAVKTILAIAKVVQTDQNISIAEV
ncbi:MAG: TerB family tellurite resistance protein [Bacteroidales bacterium]|nr:TerB family tellurite resistance protein [Bacteroidales bacterium]